MTSDSAPASRVLSSFSSCPHCFWRTVLWNCEWNQPFPPQDALHSSNSSPKTLSVCRCVCARTLVPRMSWYTWVSQKGNSKEAVLPLPSLCDLQKSNSAQAWRQAPLPVKPSYQPGPDVQPDTQEMGFQRMHESLQTVCKLFMQEYCTMAILHFSWNFLEDRTTVFFFFPPVKSGSTCIECTQ